VDIAVPLTRLKDETWEDGIRFPVGDEAGNTVACRVIHDHADRMHYAGTDDPAFTEN
jgi:hypothetical protein